MRNDAFATTIVALDLILCSLNTTRTQDPDRNHSGCEQESGINGIDRGMPSRHA